MNVERYLHPARQFFRDDIQIGQAVAGQFCAVGEQAFAVILQFITQAQPGGRKGGGDIQLAHQLRRIRQFATVGIGRFLIGQTGAQVAVAVPNLVGGKFKAVRVQVHGVAVLRFAERGDARQSDQSLHGPAID